MGRIGLEGPFFLASLEETLAFGQEMASRLPSSTVIALSGDLGAGKTTFVQGLALGLGILEPIQSPTFILLNAYNKLFHFDLYRMKNSADFLQLGFDEYFEADGICAIEWAERIHDILPPKTIFIHFRYEGNGRMAEVRS